MYYNSRKKLRIVSVICILVMIWCVLFVIDYLRVNKNMPPIFAIKTVQHENGNKEIYCALYKVNMYIIDGKPKYEMHFLTLKYDEDKNIDIYVEPYDEPDNNIEIYVEPYSEPNVIKLYVE